MRLIRKIINGYNWFFIDRPKKVTYGSLHADKVFYVIKRDFTSNGIGAILRFVLVQLREARKHNYTPIIDISQSQYGEEQMMNAWESFFLQPRGYSLSSILEAKSVVYCRASTRISLRENLVIPTAKNLDWIKDLAEVYKREIQFNEKTQQFVDNEYKSLIAENQKVLGVLCRGTDYTHKKPKDHPIQPTIDQMIVKVKEVFYRSTTYDKIYLASEDAEVVECFYKEFGDLIITNNQRLYSQGELATVEKLHEIKDISKNEIAIKYLSSMNILSKCNGFIGGCTAGTEIVFWMTSGFDYEFVWDLGVY